MRKSLLVENALQEHPPSTNSTFHKAFSTHQPSSMVWKRMTTSGGRKFSGLLWLSRSSRSANHSYVFLRIRLIYNGEIGGT